MKIKEITQGKPIFENTKEAISFGENANIDEMKGLFEKLAKVFMQDIVFLNFNIQMVGEAIHAYKADEWYVLNKKGGKIQGKGTNFGGGRLMKTCECKKMPENGWCNTCMDVSLPSSGEISLEGL